MNVRASAPGKLVLLGEYAVLFGAPALVMAVDRRASAEIVRGSSSAQGITIEAPDVHARPVRVKLCADGRLHWLDGADAAPAFTLVAGVLRGMAAMGLIASERLASCSMRLDTSAFFINDGGRRDKLGLGSSAALTVALASALVAFAGDRARLADRPAWLASLLQLHRDFQGGRGSGLDVAASVHGGTIRYCLLGPSMPEATPAVWPAEIRRLMVWSGHSASTARFLEELDRWRAGEPVISAKLLESLAEISRQGVAGAASGDVAHLLHSLNRFADGLQALGESAKIQVFTPEHQRIRSIVEACGALYKPCGAGGGDLGVALVAPAVDVDAVRKNLAAAGFGVIPLAEDPQGLKLDVF